MCGVFTLAGCVVWLTRGPLPMVQVQARGRRSGGCSQIGALGVAAKRSLVRVVAGDAGEAAACPQATRQLQAVPDLGDPPATAGRSSVLLGVAARCVGGLQGFADPRTRLRLPQVNLLRMSTIVVSQQPSGVKASLLRSLQSIPEDRMNAKPKERSRLYFLLAWLHAIVQERLRYSPFGWTKAYEFSDADQRVGLDAIDIWLDSVSNGRDHVSPDKIPWTALRSLLSESVYGGRIDNEFDQRLLQGTLAQLFVPESFNADFSLVREWVADDAAAKCVTRLRAPDATTRAQFLAWVSRLPASQSPVWLGLPAAAELRMLQRQGGRALGSWLRLQDDDDELAYGDDAAGGGGGRGAATGWVASLAESAAGWLELLPPPLPPMERTAERIKSPLFRCCDREVGAIGELLATIRDEDLGGIIAVGKGDAKSSNRLRAVMAQLSKGACCRPARCGLVGFALHAPNRADHAHVGVVSSDLLPASWCSVYSTIRLPVQAWLLDLVRRVQQLATIRASPLDRLGSTGLWLGGFSAPEAFVTAARQEVARVRCWHCGERVCSWLCGYLTRSHASKPLHRPVVGRWRR